MSKSTLSLQQISKFKVALRKKVLKNGQNPQAIVKSKGLNVKANEDKIEALMQKNIGYF